MEGVEKGAFKPYTRDLEYLEDQFEILETKIKMKKVEYESDDPLAALRNDKRTPESILRELKSKVRTQRKLLEGRLDGMPIIDVKPQKRVAGSQNLSS